MIITCNKEDDNLAVVKFLSKKWLLGSLIGLIVLLVGAMLVLLSLSQGMYSDAGEEFTERFINFDNTTHAGAKRVVYVNLYEADTLLILCKNSNQPHDFVYLDKECASEVKDILADSNANLNLFWLKGNYEVLAHYECRGVTPATKIEFSKRYFTGKGNTKVLLTKYSHIIERANTEIVTIN